MHQWSRAESTRSRVRGPAALFVVVTAGVLIGVLGIAPLRSQLVTLEAARTTAPVPADDPWSGVWDGAPAREVPLSVQNLVPPFGGGVVDGVVVRALFDDERIYLSLEWSDPAAEAEVNATEAFSDAAALQFPAIPGSTPPYTMGSEDEPVNIWQWKAVWQHDIDEGFATSATRYPDTYADVYPNADDPLFNPAGYVGNPLAQRTHASSVENLVAAGFGTLTSAAIQDVEGSGEWRDGTWRVVFGRPLQAAADGLAGFTPGSSTQVAFAVWDGGSGDRNGLKSIAQFIQLDVGPVVAPPPPEPPDDTVVAAPAGDTETEIPWVVIAVVLAALLPVLAMVIAASRAGRGSAR